MLKTLAMLVSDSETSDLTLVCGEERRRVHSFLLTNRSPYFRASLAFVESSEGRREIEVKDCTPEVLTQAVNFIYGVEIEDDFTDHAGLLDIAVKFKMQDLKDEVGMLIAKELDQDNYLEIGRRAEKYEADLLAEKCARFVLHKASDVDWDEIKRLPMVTDHYMRIAKELMDQAKHLRKYMFNETYAAKGDGIINELLKYE